MPTGTERRPLMSKTHNEDLSQFVSDLGRCPHSIIFSATNVTAKITVAITGSITVSLPAIFSGHTIDFANADGNLLRCGSLSKDAEYQQHHQSNSLTHFSYLL